MSDDERPPPAKIRVTGLQEVHLHHLARIELACAAMYQEVGLSVPPLNDVEIASLFRSLDLLVAEADHEVAGYLTWADEPPKVAVLHRLNVAPAQHRFGIGTRLLRELGENAQRAEIHSVVVRCWTQAPWAGSFLSALGFEPVSDDAPASVRQWRDQADERGELSEPGQQLLWRSTDKLGVKIIPGIPLPS